MNKPLENKPRLLDQVRDKLRLKHYSYRTEQSYIAWIKRFIFFHNKQHPFLLEFGSCNNWQHTTKGSGTESRIFILAEIGKAKLDYADFD